MENERLSNNDAVRVTPSRRWFAFAALVLLCSTALSVVYLVRERRQVRQLAASRDELSAALTQTRGQLEALSAKLNALSATRAASAASRSSSPAVKGRHNASVTKAPGKQTSEDPRWKQVQAQLSEQEKQIAKTREDVDKNREDLQSKLNSTRDELSGSIARTHEELVTLQKRGERNYHEFQLTKSKQFQRVGSISLSLRKANVKRKSYDLAMIVDDFQLQKKDVNLYEPVLLTLADRPQPLELVINQINKNQVRGYLSEPKYKKAELATTGSAGSKSPRPAPPQ